MYGQMQQWMQDMIGNSKLMDYRIGTVTQLNPIKIDFGDNKKMTQYNDNLLFTEQVLEKKITLAHSHNAFGLAHEHVAPGGSTSTDLLGSYETTENSMSFTIAEGIKVGDKLLMLVVPGGQQWIVLSKLRTKSKVTINQDNVWEWS